MEINKEQINPTKLKLTIVADHASLDSTKQQVISRLSKTAKVPGFRQGKAPASLVEKQIDPAVLQSEFIDTAINKLYVSAVEQEKMRPVSPPQIAITKFVPFSTLEFTVEIEVVGEVELADYKKIKLPVKKVVVTEQEVTKVLENLAGRAATKEEVTRAAKAADEVIIDFAGNDLKTNEPIEGAAGKDYPLVIGSDNFIPGFETELIGLKPASNKTFTITFPKDYAKNELQNRQVSFEVKVKQVQQLSKPKLDDAFAATIGPFATVAELKADIKKQVKLEKQQEAQRAYDNELLDTIASKSTVAIPPALIEEEIDRIEEDEKRNIVYRGQTWQEHLDAEGLTADEHREKQRTAAEMRVKAGLILGEISAQERVSVTPEELDIRIQSLKGQYPDPAMQVELDKPENRRDIMSRMLTEKTLDKLRDFASK